MTCSIYVITNSINKKVYVGQTWKTLEHRFNGHCIKQKDKISRIFNAINKYGRDNFKIECIAMCSDQETADYLEILYIKEYNSIKTGYNLRLGGSRGKHSTKTIEKMKLAQRGEKNHRFGKKNSVEHNKALHSKNQTQEYRDKMSKIKMGHPGCIHSEEVKKQCGCAGRGKTWKLIDGKRVWLPKEGI